jgi:hypothetical protein
LAAPVVPALVPTSQTGALALVRAKATAADSIRIGLGLPVSVEEGVIGRTEDLNRETLRQPQRPSPQQELPE